MNTATKITTRRLSFQILGRVNKKIKRTNLQQTKNPRNKNKNKLNRGILSKLPIRNLRKLKLLKILLGKTIHMILIDKITKRELDFLFLYTIK
jgi:hypothetical protein